MRVYLYMWFWIHLELIALPFDPLFKVSQAQKYRFSWSTLKQITQWEELWIQWDPKKLLFQEVLVLLLRNLSNVWRKTHWGGNLYNKGKIHCMDSLSLSCFLKICKTDLVTSQNLKTSTEGDNYKNLENINNVIGRLEIFLSSSEKVSSCRFCFNPTASVVLSFSVCWLFVTSLLLLP